MLTLSDLESALVNFGLNRTEETKKKVLFIHPEGELIYLNRDSGRRVPGLVIHPRHETKIEYLASLEGVVRERSPYHSSNMRRFPKRRNLGEKDIPYGIPFSFESIPALESFLRGLLRVSSGSPFEDIAYVEDDLNKLTVTERDAVVKSRIGQGPFRTNLERYWRECAVTGCVLMEALRASHIKPWRESNNHERLDVYNGLLLTANLDALFDRGLVSFSDDGQIIMSSRVSKTQAEALGIKVGACLKRIEPKHRAYLSFHREMVFLK